MATYYVATTGSDSNPGTLASPFRNWQKLSSVLVPGDTAYIRGGTYRTAKPIGVGNYPIDFRNLNGTSGAHITISAYPGEFPIMNFDNIVETAFMIGFYLGNCSYIDFIGLRLTTLNQNPAPSSTPAVEGWYIDICNHVTFTRCEIDHIQGPGCRVTQATPTANIITFTNCDSHHNGDPLNTGGGLYGNADGFDANGGTVTYNNCRAWWNSDDGFDCFYNDSIVTYNNCWSFWNGYKPGTFDNAGVSADGMGFKWGIVTTPQNNIVRRKYTGCIAFQNKVSAFDKNTANCAAQFYNCTSYSNQVGWSNSSPSESNVIVNCISFSDGTAITETSGTINHNTFGPNAATGATPTTASFASLVNTGVDGPRQADGSLPNLQFLRLAAGSNLIDKGTADATYMALGLTFTGSSPDLGAFESGTGSTTTTTTAPSTTTTTSSTSTTSTTSTSTTTTTTLALTALPFVSVSGSFTESPTGTWGTGTGYGLTNKLLAADGFIQATYASATNSPAVIGLDLGADLENYTTFDYGIYVQPSDKQYVTIALGTTTLSGVIAANNDIYRLSRAGSTIKAEYSRTNGQTWVTLRTFPVTSSANLYAKGALPQTAKTLLNPKGYQVSTYTPTTTTTTTTTSTSTTTTSTSTTTTTTAAPTTTTTTTSTTTTSTTTTSTTSSTTTTTTLSLTPLNFVSVSGTFVESPTGTWGSGVGYALTDQFLAGDGFIQADFTSFSVDATAMIALDTGSTLTDFPQFDYGLLVRESDQKFGTFENNVTNTINTIALPGDKFRISRASGVVKAEYSRDNGQTWNTLRVFTVITSANLYAKASIPATNRFLKNPAGYQLSTVTTTTTTTTSTTTTTTLPLTILTFPVVSGNLSESPTGRWGPGYGYGLTNKYLISNGFMQADYQGSANAPAIIGLDTSNTLEDYSAFSYAMYVGTNSRYVTITSGSSVTSNVTAIVGDKYRLSRTGTTVKAEYSRNNGQTWVTVRTFTGTTSSNLYLKGSVPSSTDYILNPKGYNVSSVATTTTSTTTTTTSAPLKISVGGKRNVTCLGGTDGFLFVGGVGGVKPYTFSLNGGPYGSSGTFSGLVAGRYTATVKDDTGATFSVTVTIYDGFFPC